MNLWIKAAAGILILAGAADSVQAVTIKNGGGTTLFSDNFEDETIGAAPSTGTGSWSVNGGGTLVATRGGSTPAAAEGSQFLEITRPGSAIANFGSVSSGTIHTEFMLFVRSQNFASHGTQVILRNSGLSQYQMILSVQSSGLVRIYDGSAYADSLASVAFDTWQKWTIDADLDANTYNFSVNGINGLANPDVLHDGTINDTQYLYFTTGGGTNPQYLVDAVPIPEPTTSLALAGLAGLAFRRRRAVSHKQ